MNIVKVMGGLGNQMFQYAFAKKVYGYLDIDFYSSQDNYTEKIPPRDFLLDKFNCHYSIVKNPQIVIYVNESMYDDKHTYSNTYFDGYWQKPSMYKDLKYELLNDFTLKDEYITDEMKKIAKQMKRCESVVIHVRRTDYVTLGCACDKQYYFDAITSVRQEVKNPVFYIFSDDIEWCKENFKGYSNCKFIHFKDYQDLYLMSQAKHIIMSNSSFSFWAQYLDKNLKSVTVPKQWNGVPSYFTETGEYL